MVLSKDYTLYDEYGRSVLDIRDKTEFGAFSYVNSNTYLRASSVGRFCAIGPNLMAGM